MRFKATRLVAGLIAAASIITAIGDASAMPIVTPQVTTSTEQQPVQYRRHGGHERRGWYGGHRGYRDQRRGYRRHSDGYWYPLAALGAGALIGGAIASQPRAANAGINPRHFDWCASRYRTYRAFDNTYVPSVGMRAVCQSPYY